jgi:hypothetical protein
MCSNADRFSYAGALRLLVLCAGAVLPSLAFAALNHNPSAIKGISQAYGFMLGQEVSLARIERTYPDAAMQVEMARAAFNAAFPDIKRKLEAELTAALTEPKFTEMRTELNKKLNAFATKQQITPQLAQQFLEQVKARAKGDEMEPEVLRYLLTVRYATNPAGEFFDGFRQRYKTDGTGKSQGLRFHLQLPRSWLIKEGERPHVVQKWVSEGGTGLSNIILMVQDTAGETPGRAEMDQFVRSGEIRESVPDDSKYLDGGAFSQEKSAGYWIDMAMPQERAGMKMYSRGRMYVLFFRGKAISVMCMAASAESEEVKVTAAAVKLNPLCQQVMNSVVLDQAY